MWNKKEVIGPKKGKNKTHDFVWKLNRNKSATVNKRSTSEIRQRKKRNSDATLCCFYLRNGAFCWRPSYIELSLLVGVCLINTNIHYWLIRVAVGEWINGNFCRNEQKRQQWWGKRKPFICRLVFCRFLSHTRDYGKLELAKG